LLESVDWQQIGVSKVFSAENGEAGLLMAKRILPEIVLTDIRMPRMDGITMATHIREILPESRIVFLSAYSEIDYYKAAIDLKAIRYLDKPVESEQLKSVISEAVMECTLLNRYKSTSEFHHLQEKQKIADAICIGESDEFLTAEHKRLKLGTSFRTKDYCTSIIIYLRQGLDGEIYGDIPLLASSLGESVIYPTLYSIRHKNRIALFIFTPTEISSGQTKTICRKLQEKLHDHDYYIVIGKVSRGLSNANKSYNSAKNTLDMAYLHPWGSVVYHRDDAEKRAGLSSYAKDKQEILRHLSEENKEETLDACQRLYHKLQRSNDLIFHKARELYFELISDVFQEADSSDIIVKDDEAGEAISWIVLIESYNLDELNDFLCRQISQYFEAMEDSKVEKKQVLAIKKYITKNYMDDTLSVGDISSYLHMSASHVCTMFKKETGDTINNYLTEYRLTKAKKYLRETLLTASDISIRVGYRDSSYFGRLFRKRTGMTPNDYRNR
jgi:two-component system response regulator YesN